MQLIKKLLCMIGYKSDVEKQLEKYEEFYFRVRSALTSSIFLDAFYDESLPGAVPLAEAVNKVEEKNNTPVKLALRECFQLLDVYFGLNEKTPIENIKLSMISEDFKSRPDLIVKLVLPRLIENPKLSLEQIKAID